LSRKAVLREAAGLPPEEPTERPPRREFHDRGRGGPRDRDRDRDRSRNRGGGGRRF
jgi:hypothetical protein